MRSRLAITALLATGALMSSGGAALGVSALSTDLSASAAQYGTTTEQVAGSSVAGTAGTGAGTGNGGSGTLGANSSGGTSPSGSEDQSGVAAAHAQQPTASAQAPRQISASQADELPFTGYAAIPLLLIGLALLATGLVLRRGTRRVTQT